MTEVPPIEGVLETVLYYRDEEATLRFYRDTLGLREIGRVEGRHMFFRCGDQVFLLFDARSTLEGKTLPSHGAEGPGHACFKVGSSYERWRQRLTDEGVEIIQEAHWPPDAEPDRRKGSSFYFRDPAGNLLEMASADFWPS